MNSKTYPKELYAGYSNKLPGGKKAARTVHRITHNPTTAKSGETLYINCPKLSPGTVMVPNSLNLVFDLNLSGSATNTVVQNVSKNIISKCVLKYDSTELFVSKPQLIETYRDLFRHQKERDDILYGFQNMNLRKVRSGSAVADAGSDNELLYNVYGRKYCILLDHPMISNHGAISTGQLKDIQWSLTLTDPKFLMTSDGEIDYTLTNIQLQYETIDDNLSTSSRYYYEYINSIRTSTWKQSDTILNETVNTPMRSAKGILILFTMDQPQTTYDSEQFINPSIKSVKVTFEGAGNRIYAQGYEARDFWPECRRYFAQGITDMDMSEVKFLKDKFCLFIDLRTFPNINHHGQGLKVLGTQDGIHLAITKSDTKAGEDKNIYAHIYTISDAQITIEGSLLKTVMY